MPVLVPPKKKTKSTPVEDPKVKQEKQDQAKFLQKPTKIVKPKEPVVPIVKPLQKTLTLTDTDKVKVRLMRAQKISFDDIVNKLGVNPEPVAKFIYDLQMQQDGGIDWKPWETKEDKIKQLHYVGFTATEIGDKLRIPKEAVKSLIMKYYVHSDFGKNKRPDHKKASTDVQDDTAKFYHFLMNNFS